MRLQSSLNNQTESEFVVIMGGTARAACWSAARAGLQGYAIDSFADLDLPPGFVPHHHQPGTEWHLLLTEDMRSSPVLPTGCWENWSRSQREKICQGRELWNTSEPSLQLARNPFLLQEVLKAHDFPSLQISQGVNLSDSPHMWITKHFQSVGGFAIFPYEDRHQNWKNTYQQEFKPGPVYSANFSTTTYNDELPYTVLLGITRQLIGCPELPDRPFGYTGNVGPIDGHQDAAISSLALQQIQQTGTQLALSLGLNWLWGFDFILSNDEIYVIEVNPRYTSAIEILELGTGRSFLEEIRQRQGGQQPISEQESATKHRLVAKTVLFADQKMSRPTWREWNPLLQELFTAETHRDCWKVPVVSDYGGPETEAWPGDPICTLWATGDTEADCLGLLAERKRKLQDRLQRFC